MPKIFIVEDDEPIRTELARLLERNGFETAWCTSFDHVADDALASGADLVLLDLTLPGTDGQLVCRELRQRSDVLIIMLTSRVTEVDEVMGIEMGADDFVAKPYRAAVLIAHINALLRRSGAADRSTLTHNSLTLDLSRSTASAAGGTVELTKNEQRILALLMRHAGSIVSREAIMRDLWDSDAFVDDNTLTVNINRLRRSLEKIGVRDYLVTHRGRGYAV